MPETPDQLTIDTPEQVGIRFPVAGVGSRFLALLADSILQGVSYGVLTLLLFLVISATPDRFQAVARNGEKWFIASMILLNFLLYWGYFTIFEAFWNGQTPGKRLCRLRVIRDSGRQITFFESMTRNLLRAVDGLPGFYAIGIIAMLANRRNKRLGDLAAGTLVIHERAPEPPLWAAASSRTITAAVFTPPPETPAGDPDAIDLPADAVARLSADDLNVIDHFFARAIDIDLARRRHLAERLALQITTRMGIPLPEGITPERFLESAAHRLRSLRR